MATKRPAKKTARKAVAKKTKASPPSFVAKAKPAPAGSSVRSITPFLWFDNNCEAAARYYVGLFPGSRVDGMGPMGGTFTLAGQKVMALNGGPMYKHSPAFSFFVVCKDQKEVDRLWNALEGDGGTPSRCGWIDDKFGLTWQIVPEAFLRLTSDPDPKKVGAVFQAMMGMVKLDVKGLQAAYDRVGGKTK